jgi:hypothetical protein
MSEVRSSGPFVGLAVLCDRVDRQPDGSTDLIGIVDGFSLDSPFLDKAAPNMSMRLNAVIALRAGDLRGSHTVAVRGRYPAGLDGPMVSRLVEFTDETPAATLLIPVEIELEHVGTYWFDVLFDQRTITRIPFIARRGEPWT